MTNNINWANRSVKAGFVGYSQVTPVYLQNFANQPNYTPIQQKSILAGLSDRAGIDEPAFVDEKPFAYKLMEETGVDNVEVIQVNATNATDDLKNIQFPNSLKKIGSYAFRNCISLESVDLPEGMLKIPHSVFFGCNEETIL